jgi:hypothetical protein
VLQHNEANGIVLHWGVPDVSPVLSVIGSLPVVFNTHCDTRDLALLLPFGLAIHRIVVLPCLLGSCAFAVTLVPQVGEDPRAANACVAHESYLSTALMSFHATLHCTGASADK